MLTLGIPRTPAEITPDWLTEALRSNNVIRQASVVSATPEIIGAGAGFIGQLAKIAIAYDREEEGAPKTVIAKLPAIDPGARHIGNLFRFYEREIRFYEDIATKIDMCVPERYYSAMDVEGDEYVLLIQDLAPAIVGDEAVGVSVEQSERAIRCLAKAQAALWKSPMLEQLDWMPYINGPVNQSAQPSYQQAWGPFCEMFGDKLSPQVMKLGDDLREHICDLLDYMEPAPRTIIHGDFRGDNVFYGDGVNSEEFYAIDWQISTKGRGIFDVAYFLSTSVDPAIRKAHEMRLIRMWHEIIGERNDMGDYSFDQAVEDYRVSSLFMHVYTVIALGTLDTANERGVMLFNEWLRRRATAIEELDCGSLTSKIW